MGWGWRNSEKAEDDTERPKSDILIQDGRVAVLRGRSSLGAPSAVRMGCLWRKGSPEPEDWMG